MTRPVSAIIPAAGKGTRLAPFPCPKELYPIGYQDYDIEGHVEQRPKVISQYIIDSITRAGATQVYMILGDGKHDIMRYYGDGHRFGVTMAYLYQERLAGMPFALDLAYPWVVDHEVVFGMPDTIVEPTDVFTSLLARHRGLDSDLTLGLFRTDTPSKFGMVSFGEDFRVRHTIDKPKTTQLEYMWGCACWSPRFTALLHGFCKERAATPFELVLGDVFNMAIESGFGVFAVPFPEGRYIDIGTARELDSALKRFHL